MRVSIVKILDLRGHENTNSEHLDELKKQIANDGLIKNSIIVDKATRVILDGHHRFSALKDLGYKKIPVIFVDYFQSKIIVQSWNNSHINKSRIVRAGLSGKKLAPKSSKHMIRINGEIRHISILGRKVNIPLKRLK